MMNQPTDTRFRVEEEALGNVEVPMDHLWGAQTQRSHLNFPIGVERYRFRVALKRAPEVRHHAIEIVDSLDAGLGGPIEQYRTRSEERLDVVSRISEAIPHDIGNARFSAESPGERRFVAHVPQTSAHDFPRFLSRIRQHSRQNLSVLCPRFRRYVFSFVNWCPRRQ